MEFIINNSHWLLLSTGVILIILEPLILKRLKQEHYSVYTELGTPSIYINFSLKKTKALSEYIIKRKYKTLKDKKLNTYSKIFMLNLLSAIIFLVIFSIFKN